MKLIAVPGHLVDTKCPLIVPENLFLEHFLFSAEASPMATNLLYVYYLVALNNLAIKTCSR